LAWFRAMNECVGVAFLHGTVVALKRDNSAITSATFEVGRSGNYSEIHADAFVLAGGNPGGRMFDSTNAKIAYTPQELACDIGLPLIDANKFMLHPFARCSSNGVAKPGCLEGDVLAARGATVYLRNDSGEFSILDEETTARIASFKARESFPDIARKFFGHGNIAIVVFPSGERTRIRASHHYNQIGLVTTQGVRVEGMENLWAIGDAAPGSWYGHAVRPAGAGLAGCLVSAGAAADQILQLSNNILTSPPSIASTSHPMALQYNSDSERKLRAINTKGFFGVCTGDDPLQSSKIWIEELRQMNLGTTLWKLSLLTAESCRGGHSCHGISVQHCTPR
jgi:aspartate oxidase